MMIHQKGLDINEHITGRFKNGKPIVGVTIKKGLNRKKNGVFLPVNTNVFVQNDYEFTHKIDEARAILRFGDNSANAKKHLFGIEDDDGNWLNVKLDKAGHDMSGTPGNKPTFPHTDGLIVEHIPVYNGVKTNYRLGNSGINEIAFTFKYNQELTPEQRGNSIVFTRDGRDIFILPVPYAYDAAGDITDFEPVMMLLNTSGPLDKATLIVESTWVDNAIDGVIDPSVTIPSTDSSFEYATIRTHASHYLKNYSGDSGSPFINYSASDNINAIVTQADLSIYSDKVLISSSARFGASVTRILGTYIDLEWHELLRNWGSGSSWGVPEIGAVCGRYYNYNTDLWTVLGARGDGTDRNGIPDGNKTINVASDPDFQMPISDSLAQASLDSGLINILIDPNDAPRAQYIVDSMYYYFEYEAVGGLLRRGLGRGLNRGIGRGF